MAEILEFRAFCVTVGTLNVEMTVEPIMQNVHVTFRANEAVVAALLAKSGNEQVNAAKRIQGMDNPGDELLSEFRQKLVRHVAIQEQVAGATAEAGRALAQFRMMADSRAVRGNVLSAMVRGGGGKDTLQDVANVILDAQELEPGKFNALIDKALKPTWKNKLTELYVNFLRSFSPSTTRPRWRASQWPSLRALIPPPRSSAKEDPIELLQLI